MDKQKRSRKMDNPVTFVINYDPLEENVRFSVRNGSRVTVDVMDGEALKDYENTEGIFNLEGQKDKILKYIKENFEGETEVNIELNVPKVGYEKRKTQFDRFKKSVSDFNQSNTLNLRVIENVVPSDSIVSDSNVNVAPSDSAVSDSFDVKPSPKAAPSAYVAVVGKIGSGKTELIKGMCGCAGTSDKGERIRDGVTMYTDAKTDSTWYEVDGIGIEKDSVRRTTFILSRLVEDKGVNVVLYCLRCRTGMIEDIERDFVVTLKCDYPDLKIFAVVTECIDEYAAHEFAQKISLSTEQTRVFNVLARGLRCKVGYLEPFGLEKLAGEICGGAC
jgi:hypothetical protein